VHFVDFYNNYELLLILVITITVVVVVVIVNTDKFLTIFTVFTAQRRGQKATLQEALKRKPQNTQIARKLYDSL